jgi:penicillin-binding protein 2
LAGKSIWPQAGKARGAPRPFLVAQVFVVAVFTIIAGRLWQLQVLSGDHYYRKSADNFVKDVELPAPRGRILDREGRPLAENRPKYDVLATPRFFDDEALQALARHLRLGDEEADALKARVAARKGLERYRPMVVREDISRDELALIESDLQLSGVTIKASAKRDYPHATSAAHLIGYLAEIKPDELADRREEGYQSGDLVGRAGLERRFESFLRGKDGVERIVVDAKGRKKDDLADAVDLIGAPRREEPVPGLDLVTTVDLDLQRAAEAALARHRSAAAVVLDVETGRILAMASHPAPDPNRLTGRLTKAEADALINDEARPLLDKTVRENYFPGSTFKVVPMLAAVTDEIIDPEEKHPCKGAVQYGRRWFHCVEPHGKVDLHGAVAESCNVYFFDLGDRLGIDRMAQVARDLGFGEPTGLGLNGEVSGFIPTSDFYKKRGDYQRGVALNAAIGQGSVKVTILQLAAAYAAIANGGRLYVPQVLERIRTPSGQTVQSFPPLLRRKLTVSDEGLRRLRRALDAAVNDPKGTSYAVRMHDVRVAGKTGTAQVGNRRVRTEGTPDADHAWFASFAPADAPQIAVVVLVEHGGFGAKSATPVAMDIYRSYFRLPLAEARPPGKRAPAAAARRRVP